MKWNVTISIKSGKFIEVNDLQYINQRQPLTGEISKITDFKDFRVSRGTELTLVGNFSTVALASNEIEFVQFDLSN